MRTKIALLATTTLASLALAAPAQAAGSGWYVSATGGANWLDDTNFVAGTPTALFFSMNTDADTGWVVAGAVGLGLGNVWSGLRAEVEVAYRENNVDAIYGSNSAGSPQTGTVDYDQQSFSVLANVWLDIPVGSGFTPYVGGGLGWADTEAEGTFTCNAGICIGTTAPFNVSDDGFAWQLGAGVNFQVSPNMQLGVGYRYFRGPEPTVAAPFTTAFTGDLENNNHAAAVTLSFGM
jgi:opacity protein-like surface antigen